ncbi:SET domain [Trinorchestia longiramus]|nr:SET domain [Trinorchestia longiramus]
MKAGSKVAAGEVIISALPFIQLLKQDRKGKLCDFCFKPGNVRKCMGCGVDYYCSMSCQKKDWKITHKCECPLLKRLKPFSITATPRMVAKAVICLQNGGREVAEQIDENYSRTFNDLLSHKDSWLSNCKAIEEMSVLFRMMRCYLGAYGLPSDDELLAIYGALQVNSFEVTNANSTEIGSALYLSASIFDHSCYPNAGVVFDGSRIFVRALQDMPDFQWSKVRVNYIDCLTGRDDRRRSLQRNYFFQCHCVRCEDPVHNDLENSFICGTPSCKNVLPVGEDSVAPCSRCGFSGYTDCVAQYWAVVELCRQRLLDEAGYEVKCGLEPAKDLLLQLCAVGAPATNETECLVAALEHCVLHPFNIWRVKALNAVNEAAITAKHFGLAMKVGLSNVDGMRYYYGKNHQTYGFYLSKLGKLCVYGQEMRRGVELLQEALTSIIISHGSDHPLARSVTELHNQAQLEIQFRNASVSS